MEVKISRAFSPAHISLGFVPHIDEKNPLRSGSLGFGMCLTEGVTTQVEMGSGTLEYTLNGRTGDREFLEAFIKRLKERLEKDFPDSIAEIESLKVSTEVAFPLSQGYGISASSLLSLALALLPFLDRDGNLFPANRVDALRSQERLREVYFTQSGGEVPEIFRTLVESVHEHEVDMLWGLGDMVGALRGGVEIRRSPGVPPHGKVEKLYLPGECFLYTAVLGREVPTPEVLRERNALKKIRDAYRDALKVLERGFTAENLFKAGEVFGRRSELCPPDILEAIERLKAEGILSSPVMIGSTICAYLDNKVTDDIYSELEGSHQKPEPSWEGLIKEKLKRRMDSLLKGYPLSFSRISKVDYMGARILFSEKG